MTLLLDYWKPIVGYETKYEISITGKVRSITSQKLLRGWTSRGYYRVELWHDGDLVQRSVHSLVAEHFHGPRPDGLHINHLNGWKAKNWASNLEYLTQADNNRHAIDTGLNRPTIKNLKPFQVGQNRKLTDSQIEEMKALSGKFSAAAIGRMFGVHDSYVSRVMRGLRRTSSSTR